MVKWKGNEQIGKKYFQYINLTKDLYPDYIKNFYNSISQLNFLKMDIKFGLHKRKHEWPINPWKDTQYHSSSGKCKLWSPWNATFTPTGIANSKKTDHTKWWWGRRATGTLILMETQNDIITLKNSLAGSYKFKHSFFISASSSTPGYLPKRNGNMSTQRLACKCLQQLHA